MGGTAYTVDGGTVTSFASIDPGGDPYLLDTAVSDSALGATTAQSILTYYFEVMPLAGGQVGAVVPVNIVANSKLTTSLPFSANAAASAEFYSQSVNFIVQDSTLSGPDSFAVNQTTNLIVGQVYDMHLESEAVAGGFNYSTANIDPLVTIDPTFAQANDYSVDLSPNLTVPEPSTWAMLLGGLSLLAFWRIRTRRLI